MSSADEKPFQVRLSLKGNIPRLKSIQGSKPNHVVTVAPLMTMEELLSLAHERFGVPKNTKNRNGYEIELWNGFPPKRMDLDDAGSLASLVTANGIRGGEALTVKIEKITKAKKSSSAATKATAKKQTTKMADRRSRKRPLPSSTNTTEEKIDLDDEEKNGNGNKSENQVESKKGRPKRATAQAASNSFKEVIRAQDKMIRDEKKKAKSSSSVKKKKVVPTTAQTEGRKRAAEARAAAANARKIAALPGGRRLNDDAPATIPAPAPARSVSRSQKNSSSIFKNMNSEDDISYALISSIDASGSKGGGKVSKVLRGAMRKTVEKSYEASRAVVRHSAIASGLVTFTRSGAEGENTANSMGTCKVRYPKGVEGVGFYEETCHIITTSMLKAVLQAVYDDHDADHAGDTSSGREMLKPQNMALLSTRVFWSLWYHYHQYASTIEEALEKILPDLDWSFLYRRSRQLSEKAKENLRQESEENGGAEEEKKDHKAGVEAILAVEKAMETMYDETVTNSRERAAEAALARFGRFKSSSDWALITPTEVDEDELQECINEDSTTLSSETVAQVIGVLIKKMAINNWRVLANSDPGEIMCLLQKDVHGVDIDSQSVKEWINAAQIRSVEEIMLEIIDGDQDLYCVLSEELSSNTPKDLSLWVAIPSMIIEEARTDLTGKEEDLRKYCERAKKAVETLDWLQLYSTSICNST